MSVQSFDVLHPKASGFSKSQIAKIAGEISKKLNFIAGESSIRDVLEKKGFKIKTRSFMDWAEKHDSIHVKFEDGEENPDIRVYLSETSSQFRENFTLAHELGHFVLHYIIPGHQNNRSEFMATRNGEPELVEFEANRFSAEFLMPRDTFTQKADTFNQSESKLSAYFKVSQEAVRVRIQDLNI